MLRHFRASIIGKCFAKSNGYSFECFSESLSYGKSIFSLEDEKVDLKNFIGDLTIENGKIKLEGYVERLDIRGASGISITS